MHLGECELGSTKKYNTSASGDHREDSVEAGVRLINDEENEDEFNVILRQQSAEDESSVKGSKPAAKKDHHTSKNAHSSHRGNGTTHNRHHGGHNRPTHHNRSKQLHPKHHSSSRQQSAIHRRQRSQLCRKLRCQFNSICKLDQSDLNQTTRSDGGQLRPANQPKMTGQLRPQSRQSIEEDNVELTRISMEVTAYCDCSHINCDSNDREKNEELCGSDGKLYQSACQMKEKSCKMQMNIHVKPRSFCDSNKPNEPTRTSRFTTWLDLVRPSWF